MIYRITTHDGRTLRTTTRDLLASSWSYIEDQNPREIDTENGDGYGWSGRPVPDRLCLSVVQDTGDWSGYETDALRVRNEHGRVEYINFSAVRIWSEDGRNQFCVGGYEADGVEDDRGIPVSVSEILDAAGFAVSEPDVDYTSLAEEFVAANPDARYYVDDERGFANEWTLVIRMEAERQDDEDDDSLREITAEEAVHYIADAVMEPRDYEAIHGCEPYVTAVVEA